MNSACEKYIYVRHLEPDSFFDVLKIKGTVQTKWKRDKWDEDFG